MKVVIDHSKCQKCGTCFDYCPYYAIEIAEQIKVFEHLCKNCGSCIQMCPSRAISRVK